MEKENTEKNSIQWQPLIEMIIVLVTILGSTIPLYLHTDNKLTMALEAIRQENKDFHSRLCVIEERSKK